MADTTTGQITGTRRDGLDVYLGVPYAEPPVGARRWQAPVPAHPAATAATAFGRAAPQLDGPPSVLPTLSSGPTAEDCLTLNVWAPMDATPKAVMVWIHGGGFTTGSSAVPTYDGARLATEGNVVVVSANYRLGALGFSPMRGVANLGLLDLLLALEWVHDNIGQFGGDPARITVFGESAGGGAILHVLATAGIERLVARAIVQSGATTLTLTDDQTEMVADHVRSALGTDPMTAPVEQIIAVQDKALSALVPVLGAMPFHPSIDGELVDRRPIDAVRDLGVDMLVGTTAHELNTYLDEAAMGLGAERLAKRAARYLALYGVGDADTLLTAYDALPSPGYVWAALRTDAEMWLPALGIAEAHSGRNTFMYRFDWPAAAPNAHLGACHGIDLPFTFGTFDRDGWDTFVGYDAEAEALGTALRQAWARFATTGDPGWPAYGAERTTMVLGAERTLARDPRGEIREAWAAATKA